MKNMKKISIAFILLLAVTLHSNAQVNDGSTTQFGMKGGANFSNLYNDDVDDNNVLTSFNAGLYATFPLTDFIAIQPEVLYSRKGAEMVYDNAFASGAAKFKLNYIEVPLLLKVNVAKNFSVHAGPYFAYLIDAQISNESDSGDYDFEDNFDNEDFNKFDAGLAVGVGLDLDKVGVGLRYNYGLSTVGKERTVVGQTYTVPDAKNSNLSLYLTVQLN